VRGYDNWSIWVSQIIGLSCPGQRSGPGPLRYFPGDQLLNALRLFE
jgi:hypothetical protein